MQNAFSTPLGPILVLWLGAIVFYLLDQFLEPQDAGVAETVVLALATGMLLLGRARVDLAHLTGRDRHARSVYGHDLVLLRPDHHVAWRGRKVPENEGEILRRVSGF